MKNIITSALILAVGSFAFTSCMEETFPTSGLTEDQLAESSKALSSLATGMPGYMIKNNIWDGGQTDFGYPSRMIIRNLQTQDCLQNYNGYQHFYWAQNASIGMNDQYLLCQSQWYYYNFQVQACNNLIAQIDENTEEPVYQNLLAQGLAYRASTYLDMARTYEFLPNATGSPVNSEGNDVTGLTVPVCTPGMTEE
ncbi:MAG: RagB/SusD family nutrient uptake outer membrane protein, partial [Muribaculaceae bacterium]|nr:RagB/SusD family nutrient uptake outer membrane protein [Muribaculaceae bacterium]